MAPLPDLPHAPPVRKDELHRKRRPKPGKIAVVPPPDPDEAERNVITVRFNRRLGWWLVLIGWPMVPVMMALSIYLRVSFDGQESTLGIVLVMVSVSAGTWGLNALVPKNCLTYDVRRGRVGSGAQQVRNALARWRGGDRLEYSIHLGRLQIVRPNGKRRDVVRNSFILDRGSWTAFVDVFLAQQNSRAGSNPEAPAASPVESDPAVKVGVRWRFFGVVMLGGLVLTAFNVAIWADAERSEANFDPFGPLALMAACYVLFGAIPLILRPVLTFKAGQVSVRTLGLVTRKFPRRGFERLEYSVYNGILYEVRGDGKRRRIATGWARDQVAWKTFVDRLLDSKASANLRVADNPQLFPPTPPEG